MPVDENKMEYCRQRFSEAQTPEDVERIRDELVNVDKIPRGTVDVVKNDMRRKGELPKEANQQNHVGRYPVVTRGTEVITPEGIMQTLSDGSKDWQLRLEGMMLLRAAQRMVMDDVEILKRQAEAEAKGIETAIRVMQEGREELKTAAERARESQMTMAREAAEETAARIAGYIDQKLPKGPPPKDMSEMVTKRIDKMWEYMEHMMEQRMFPGQAGKAPEGWEYEGPPPQPQPSSQHKSPQSQGNPLGWTVEQQPEEKEEHSND